MHVNASMHPEIPRMEVVLHGHPGMRLTNTNTTSGIKLLPVSNQNNIRLARLPLGQQC